MITDDFDDVSESVISLVDFYGEPKHLVDKCIIILSNEIYNYMLEKYTCKQIAELTECDGNRPIYLFEYKGEKMVFYKSRVGSALASAVCYETHWLTGATKFIMFGSCGSLDGEKTRGKFIVPTEAYRGEGASYYYVKPADYIEITNSNKVAAIFEELNIPYVKGRVWTTDAMPRETKNLVQKRRSEGCIAVEMELSGVQAVCDFYGLEVYDFLEAGDVLGESNYEVEGLQEANHSLGKLHIALEMAGRI